MSDTPEIKFAIADVKLERAKLIGIRRRLSNSIRRMTAGGQEVKPLENIGVWCAMEFLAHYLGLRLRTLDLHELDSEFREGFKILLTSFGQEDDLLWGTGIDDFEVIGEYIVALMLRGWVLGRDKAALLSLKQHRRQIRESALPLNICARIADAHQWPLEKFDQILRSQITILPTENYFNLIKSPFFRTGGEINVITSTAFDDWPTLIRSRLVKGGTRSSRYGKLWEERCAKLFSECGWLIVGQNVKVRSKGSTLTDIDVLAMQRNLLLVIQFKAMGIGGACVYDQWLARSKILRGAEQARLAVDYLRLNEKFVKTLLAGKKIKNQPTDIQPLIITSSEMFTGWNPNGIPVASIGSVASLLRGATVNYEAGTGDIVSTRKFIVGDEPTSDEFLSFLATPLDWRITEEEELVDMRRIQSELGTLWLPELTRRTRPRAKVEFRNSAVES